MIVHGRASTRLGARCDVTPSPRHRVAAPGHLLREGGQQDHERDRGSAVGISSSNSPAVGSPRATATPTTANAQPTGISRTRCRRASAGRCVSI